MSEEGSYPEATPSRKLDIATYFIMSSPTGEVDDVVSDVQALINDENILSEDSLVSILRDYNTDQLITANDPTTGAKVLISKFGQVEPNQYLDPHTGKVLEFDHKKRTFTSETDKKQVLRQDVESFRAAVSKSLESYVPSSYTKDKVAFAVYGADNGTITITISSKNINLSNYWSGSWRGVYAFNVLNGGELKGTVKLHVHYFEDGNVQLHDTVEHSANISIDSPDVTAKRIVDSISKFENDFQHQLEEMYVNMNRTTFKAMRRLYPVNRQQFVWNSTAHSLATKLTSN